MLPGLEANDRVLTNIEIADAKARALPFQTNVEGVFAIGDIRSGSIKRVASAVGEGACVVAQVHPLLESFKNLAPPTTRALTCQSDNAVRGGLTRSDSLLRFLSGTSGAVMLPI